ncbi:MAG: hypothetical protein K2X27_21170, partial [Candidatus Obscuribacterales bacterium]|nr:hypothetical protein [Candidatus Obscuribacterales bacterium]
AGYVTGQMSMVEAETNEASQYQDAGQSAQAAVAWMKVGQLEDYVAKNYDKGDTSQEVSDLSTAAQDFQNAAQQSSGESAANAYMSEGKALMSLGNLDVNTGNAGTGTVIFNEAAGAFQQAVQSYGGDQANMGKAQLAEAQAYDGAGNWSAANSQYDFAEDNLQSAGLNKLAGEAFLGEAQDDIKMGATWQEAVNFQNAGQQFDAAHDYSDAAQAYENSAQWYAKGQNNNWQANEISTLEAAGADYNNMAATASGAAQVNDYQNAAVTYDQAGHLDQSTNQMSDFSNAAEAYQNEAQILAKEGHSYQAGNAYQNESTEWGQAAGAANNHGDDPSSYSGAQSSAALSAAEEYLTHDKSTGNWADAGKQENIIAQSQGDQLEQAQDYAQAANYFAQANDKTDEIAALQNAGNDYQSAADSEVGVNGQKAVADWQQALGVFQQEVRLDESLGTKSGDKAAGNVLMNNEAQILETWDPNWNTQNGNPNIEGQLEQVMNRAVQDYTKAGDTADAQNAESEESEIGGGN